MMKYIFCIIALLIQPVFSWYVYHKQDKKKAALRETLRKEVVSLKLL